MEVNPELSYCVEKAKEVLLSLDYPCSDLVVPVEKVLREELRPGLRGAAKPFAVDFISYVTSLGLFKSESRWENGKDVPSDLLKKLEEIKPEDFIDHIFKKNYSPSSPLGKLLQQCS